MIPLIKVLSVKTLNDFQLQLRFSNGAEGVFDMRPILAEGGEMVEPLRSPAMFARAFIELGVVTWPNGFDMDAIALHDEMASAGLLKQPVHPAQ